MLTACHGFIDGLEKGIHKGVITKNYGYRTTEVLVRVLGSGETLHPHLGLEPQKISPGIFGQLLDLGILIAERKTANGLTHMKDAIKLRDRLDETSDCCLE